MTFLVKTLSFIFSAAERSQSTTNTGPTNVAKLSFIIKTIKLGSFLLPSLLRLIT